jgi:hypothetical protein
MHYVTTTQYNNSCNLSSKQVPLRLLCTQTKQQPEFIGAQTKRDYYKREQDTVFPY